MDITIHNSNKKVFVSDEIFDVSFNEPLIHQLVVSYMSTARAGTSSQKNRSRVSGGGVKPWRQKGTGRARAGTIRSPIWRSGGVTFASTSRDYAKKLNKKMYCVGMRSLVSELIRQKRFILIEELAVVEAKTKAMVAKLRELGVNNALILTDGLDSAVCLAARNILHIQVMDIMVVDPLSLIRQDRVVIDKAALKKLEERLS